MFVAVCSDLHDYILLQNLNRKMLQYGLIPKMKQLYIIAIKKINRLESVPVFFFFRVQRIWTVLTIICHQEPQSKANVTKFACSIEEERHIYSWITQKFNF